MNTIMMLSAAAAGSLVNAIAEGVVLAIVVMLFLRLLPGITAAARFIVWSAVLLVVLPLHLIPFVQRGIGSTLWVPANVIHLDARWSLLIVAAWGALSLVRAVQLLRSAIELRRIASKATPVSRGVVCAELLKSGDRSAELCTSEDVDRPSVVGFLHPRILLPPSLLGKLTAQELEQIVLHEMEHLRRRDDWTNLLQKISLILFPLNPALNWIERRLCMERELACDDRVLHLTAARKTYATCLTNLAEHSLLRRSVSLALGAWERQSELAQRVYRILRKPEQRMGRMQTNVVTGTLIAGMLGGVVALAHSPALVSFSPVSKVASETSHTATTFEPVVQEQRTMRGFSPTYVKAVMPERSERIVPLVAKPRIQPTPVKTVHKRAKQQPTNLVVLTSWEEVVQPRLILAVSDSTTPSYTAVPVIGYGWIFVQL